MVQDLDGSLRWRHNDHAGVSNHQPHGCLLDRLFRRRSKKTSKLRVTGLCVGNSPVPVNSPHKGPVTRKMFPFDDVIMSYHGSMRYQVIRRHAIGFYYKRPLYSATTLKWRHNERVGVSNHQPHDCLLNRLSWRRSEKASKLRVTGLCAGNSPVTGEFPAQRASNVENVSIRQRHHEDFQLDPSKIST